MSRHLAASLAGFQRGETSSQRPIRRLDEMPTIVFQMPRFPLCQPPPFFPGEHSITVAANLQSHQPLNY